MPTPANWVTQPAKLAMPSSHLPPQHPPSLGIPQTSAGPCEKQIYFHSRDTHTLCIYWVCQVTFEISQVPPTCPHVNTLTCTLPCLTHWARTKLEHLLSGASLLFGICWSTVQQWYESWVSKPFPFPSLSWDSLVLCSCPITYWNVTLATVRKARLPLVSQPLAN